MVGMFGPGEAALILLSPKPAISDIQRSLWAAAQSNAEIVELPGDNSVTYDRRLSTQPCTVGGPPSPILSTFPRR